MADSNNIMQQPIGEVLANFNEDNREREDGAIEVAVEMVQRVYACMFVSSQMLQQNHINLGKESLVLFKQNLIESIGAVAVDYPQLHEFQFDVKLSENDAPTVVGLNNFTCSLLAFIAQARTAPVTDDPEEVKQNYLEQE